LWKATNSVRVIQEYENQFIDIEEQKYFHDIMEIRPLPKLKDDQTGSCWGAGK